MKHQLGEGFAFFRWHFLNWPYRCTCTLEMNNFCLRMWRGDYGPR